MAFSPLAAATQCPSPQRHANFSPLAAATYARARMHPLAERGSRDVNAFATRYLAALEYKDYRWLWLAAMSGASAYWALIVARGEVPISGATYAVEAGDTLSGIADQFGTTVDAIVEANDLADATSIDIGQRPPYSASPFSPKNTRSMLFCAATCIGQLSWPKMKGKNGSP